MLVSMTDLTKYNGEKCILDHIELHIEDKDKVGILGVNGTGKSTLLKIIAGIEDYQGKISYQKDIRINYLPQTPLYNEDDSIMETVYKQLDSKEIHDYEIKAQLGKFGIIDETQKIKELSGGQLKRVALAFALIKPCDLLILDEPTNGLDVLAREEIIDLIREFMEEDENRSVLISSHISSDLEGLCDDIYMIDDGKFIFHETTDCLLDQYGLLKLTEEQFNQVDHNYFIKTRKENYGYTALTNQKQFYQEYYPEIIIEKNNFDTLFSMMLRGE